MILPNLPQWLDITAAKKHFWIIAVIALVLIPIDGVLVWLWQPSLRSSEKSSVDTPQSTPGIASYLPELEKSSLFGTGASAGSQIIQASLAERAKDYRLKGVVLAGEAEAIIEDATTQKTIFVKKGDLLNELTVKEIQEGFVLLTSYGQEIRLEIK